MRQRYLRFLSIFALTTIFHLQLFAADWYSVTGGGDFHDVNTWNSQTDGLGSTPASINAGDNFFIQAGHPVTIAAANAISVTNLTIDGSLTANDNLTLSGNLAVSGTGSYNLNATTLSVAGSVTNSGSVTFSAGTVEYAGTSPQTILDVTYNNLTLSGNAIKTLSGNTVVNLILNIQNTATFQTSTHNIQADDITIDNGGTFTGGTGIVTVGDDLTVNGTLSGVSGAVDVNGDVLIGGTGGFTESSSTTNVAGNLTNDGTFTANGGTFTFDGGGNSIIDGGTTSFNNLIINKTGSAIAFQINDASVVVNASTTAITQGTLDFQTFSAAHDLGTVSGTANAIIAIAATAGTVTWPGGSTNLTSFVGTTGTTINYNTANSFNLPATLPGGGTTYQNIIFSGGGVKTATAALDINGYVIINDATTFADGGFTHTVAGDWTENDAAAQMTGTGTIEFDGGGLQLINEPPTTALNFNNVTVTGAGTVIRNTQIINVSGNVLINNGATWNLNGFSIDLTGTVWEELGTGQLTGNSGIRFYTASSVIRGDVPININSIRILSGDVTLEQDIATQLTTISAGTFFDVSTFQLDCDNFNFSAATSRLRIGGVDNFPFGIASPPYSFTEGIVEYYLNGAQNIAGSDEVLYHTLQITGTGNSTAQEAISANDIDLDAGTFLPNGFNVTTTADINIGASATFTGGTGAVGVGNDLVNDGTFNGGDGTTTITNNLDNNAAFVQGNGNVVVNGTFDNGASATFDGSTAALQVTGDFTNNGDFDRGAGTITVTTGNFLNAGGTFDAGTGNLVVSAGNATNAAIMDVTTGGNITVTAGTFTNSNGAQFDGGTGTMDVHTLTNEGDFDRGAGTITVTTGNFTNSATGVFDAGTGTGNLTISTGNIENSGTLNFSTGGDISVAANFNSNAGTFTGGTGTVGVTGNVNVDGTFTGGAGTIDIEGNLTVNGSGNFTESSGNTNLAGNLTSTGTFSANGGTFTFDGNTNSIIDGGTINFNNLAVNKTASTIEVEINDAGVILNAATALTITQGTFDFQTFGGNGHDLGDVNGTANAIIAIAADPAATVAWPAGATDLTNFVSTTGTTINYNTANSYNLPTTLPGGITAYQNVIFSGGGTKTATAAIDVNGNFTINDATTFADGNFSHTVAGDWAENDAAATTAGSGTIVFDGGGTSTISTTGGNARFYNFTTLNSGTNVVLDAQPDIRGNVLLNTGTTLDQNNNTIQMRGAVWEELGTGERTGTGTTRFRNGSSVIRGDAPIAFHELRVSNNGDVTLEQNVTLANRLRIDDNCTYDAATFTTTGGSDIQMNGAGSLMRLAGDNFPTGFSTATFVTGTVEYYGTGAQNVAGTDVVTYFNLQTTGTGVKTAQNTISANFIDLDAGTLASAGNAVSSTTDIDIESGAGLDASGGGNITIGNDVLNDGTFTGGAGAIAITQNLDNNANFIQGSGNMTVGGTFDNAATTGVFDGGSGTMQVTGNFTNNGDFDRGSGAITVVTGNFLNSATGTLDAGTANIIVSAGTATNDGTLDVSTGGNISVPAATFSNSNGAFFDGGAGMIDVHTLTNSGDFDRGSGTITVATGDFTNNATGVFDDGTGSGNLILSTGNIINSGTMSFTGGNISTPGNFTNNNGAAFTGGTGTIDITGNLQTDGTFTGGAGAIDIDGNLTVGGTGSFTESSSTTNLAGNLTSDGTFSANGGTFIFDGGTNSVIDGATINFNNLQVNKTAPAIEVEINDASVVVNAATALTITQGTFDFQTFGGNGHDLGDVNGTANAIIAIAANPAATVAWPGGATDLTNFVSTTGTTINYNTANSYNIPTTLPGGITTYQNVIFSQGGTKTATAALDVNGSFTINDATTFADGGFTHTVAGDWTENDAAAALTGTGTIQFDGTSTLTDVTGTLNFNNVIIADASSADAGASPITMTGNWTENTATAVFSGTGTVTFTGATGSINGTAPIAFGAVTVDNGDALTINQNISMTGDLTLAANSTYETNTFTTTGGNDIVMGTDGLIRVGGANNFPSGFNTATFTTGTVEYYLNGAQNVPGTDVVTYFNLQSTGTGDKTAQNTISANFIDMNAGTLVSNTNNISSTGDMDIETGAGINMSSGGNLDAGDDILNAGTVTGGAGTITTTDDLRNEAGGVVNQGGGNVTIGDDLVNDGTYTGNTGAIGISGDLDNDGAFTQGDGNMTVALTFDNANGATFDGGTGTMDVTGNFTNNGDFDRGSGAITVTTGEFTNTATGVFDDGTGSGNLTVTTGNILNQGTMAFTGGNIEVTAGSFTNDTGADFDGGTGTITIQTNLANSGAFDGGAGNITVTAGTYVNNASGTFTGGTGSLTISTGTATNEGVMTLAAGGDFAVSANSFTNGTAAQFTSGAGTVDIATDLINNATGAGFYNANTPTGTTNIGNDLDNNGIFNSLNGVINIANDWLNSGTFDGDNATITIDANLTNEAGGTLTPDASTFSFETTGDILVQDVDENPAKFSFNRLQIDKGTLFSDVRVVQGTIITANSTHYVNGSIDLLQTDAGSITQNHNLGNVTADGATNNTVRLRLSAATGTICQFPGGDFTSTFSSNTGYLSTDYSVVEYFGEEYTLPAITPCYKRLVIIQGGDNDLNGKVMSGDICADNYIHVGYASWNATAATTLFTAGFDLTVSGSDADGTVDMLIDRSTLNLESGSTLTMTNGTIENDNGAEFTIGDATDATTGATVLIQGADGSGYYAHDDGIFNMYGTSTFTVNQTGAANNDAIDADDGTLTLHNTSVMDLLVGDFEFPDNQDNVVTLNDASHLILRGGDLEANLFTGNGTSQVTFQNQAANQNIDASGGDYRYTFANLTLKKAGFDLTINADIRVNATLELNVYDDDGDAVLNTAGGSMFLTDEDITFGADADIRGENNVSFQNATSATAIGAFDADRMFICNGTVNTGALIFEGNGTIATDFEGIYPIGSGTDAAPTSYQYNYINLENLAASQDGANVPTMRVAVIPYPSGLSDVLNKYWTITTDNIISITQAELIFKYYDPAEITRAAGTLEVKRVDGGVEFNVPAGSVDEVAGTFTSGAANTFLETEWRMGDITNLPQTYYSFTDGDWDDPNTWTKDPFGLTQTAADIAELTARGSGPDNGDNVFIINGRTVTLAAANKTVTLLGINDGELSLTAGGHNAPTITGEANGVLRVTDDADLPTGDYTDFVAADGGTIIFENNTAVELNVNNGITGNTYNNVEFTGSGSGGFQMNNGSIFNGNVSVTGSTVVRVRRDWDIFGDLFIASGAELSYEPGETRTIDLYGNFTVEGTFTGSNKAAANYNADPGAAIQMRFLGDEAATATMNGTTIFDEILVNKNANETEVSFNADDPSNVLFWSERDANDDDEKAFEIARGVLKLNENIVVETLSEGGAQFIIEDNATLWINGAQVYSTSADGLTDRQRGVEVQGKLKITSGFLDTRDSRGIWFLQDDDGEIEIDGGTLTADALFTERNSTNDNDSRGSLVVKSGTINLDGTGLTSTGNYDAAASLFLGSVGSTFQMSGGTININGTSRDEFIIINADDIDISVTGGTININDGTGSINVREGKPFYDLNFAASATLDVDLENDINITNNFTTGNGSTFDAAGFQVALQGDWVNDNGTFTPNGNTVVFNSTSDNQEVRGVPTFSTLQVDNTFSGGVLTLSSLGASDITITADLDVQNGDLYLGKELTVNGNVTNNNTINGPRRLKFSGGAAAHQIGGDGTGLFRSIELDDANGVTLTADMTLDATLLLTNGVFGLDVYALNMNSGADIDEGGAGFDNTRMVSTAGNASDGGINRTYASTGSFTFPIGTGSIYTPASINVSAASTFGSIRVSPVAARHPLATGTNNALTYYWDVEQSGFTGITATHTYTYDDTDIQGTEASYVSGRYVGGWTQGTTADVDETNNIITFSGINLIAGAFTAGETTAFDPPQTFYSITSGNWADGNSWSLTSHAGAAAADYPQAGDVAIIGDNDIITVATDNQVSGAITIDNGATLDLGGTVGHDFGTYVGVSGEEGELRISTNITNVTLDFPGGDWGVFLGNDGGTVEYYEPVNTGNYMQLPSTVSTYYNLHLDPVHNNDNRRIHTNTQKLTIYNNFVVEDNSSNVNDFALGEIYLYADLDIGNELRLEGGAELVVMNNTAHTIEVGGDFVIQDNYGFFDNNGNAIHNLYIGGNMINNGVGDFDDGDASSTRIHFTGSSNSTWTGGVAGISGSEVSSVGQLIVNFDDTTTTLTINDPKFDFVNLDVDFGGIYGTDKMNLDVQRGIVEFQSALTPIELRSGFELPSDGEIVLNNAALEMRTLGNFEMAGVLKLIDGTINVGDGAGERLQPIVDGRARLEVEGGTLNVSGHISRSTVVTVGALDYRQSGGTVNVSTVAPSTAIRGIFEVLNDGSYFEMTGGTLVIGRRNTGAAFPSIYLQPTAYHVTGGTLVIGDATINTPAEAIEINSLVPLYNVRVDNGGNNGHSLTIEDNPLIIQNDLDIETNTTLTSNNYDLYIGGDFDNQGTYTYGTNKTFFNNTTGVGNQDLTASGTGTLDFYNVEVVSQVTVQTVGADMTVNNDLTINLGTLHDNGQRITVRHDVYNYDTHTSTGGGELLMLDDDIQNIFSDGTGIFGNVRLDNANNVQLNSNLRINGSLSFTNGNFLIQDHALTFGTAATISGVGTDKMIVTDGLSSDGGVIKEFNAAAFNFTFPIGDGTIYTPARFQSDTDPTTTGQIQVIRVADKHPATQDPLETQLNYYWKVASTGLASATVSHQYTYDQSDVPATFDETNASAVVGRFDGSAWTEGTTDVGSFNNVSNLITVEPGGSAASFIDGDYTIGYDPEFDIVPRYRTLNASGTWTTATDWESFTPPSTWATASTAPSSGEIITIQTGHTMTVPSGTSILSTSMEIESGAVLDLDETVGHDFTVLSGTGTLRLASSNFPAGINSDFVSTSGGTIEYGQGSGNYTMPAIQSEYNNLIISTNGNTLNTSTTDITVNGDFTISTNATLDNSTSLSDISIPNGNWVNNGTYTPGSALLGENPTVTFSNTSTNQSISGTNASSFYNLVINKASSELETGANVSVDGDLTLTAGSINIDDDQLTLNGTLSGAGTIKGANDADIVIGGTSGGSAGTLNFETGFNELGNFTVNRSGVSGSVTMGSDVTVRSVTTMTAGEIILDGGILTIDGTVAAGGTGSITGTCTGGLIISDSDGDANALGGELRFTVGATELGTFTMNKPSTATLGSDLTVCTTFDLTQGQLVLSTNSAHTLTVNGTYSRTTGTLTGSANSNLTIDNGSSATADLVFTSNASALLNDFTLSRSTAGPSFSTSDPTDEMTISGVMTLNGSSIFDISGAKTLNLTGYTNGSGFLRGSTSTTLNIGGTTGDALGFLNFETGNRIVQNMTMNRTGGANSTAALGTDLEVDDTFTATAGAFELNDNSLTLSGSLVRTAGTFTGSNGSDMTITGAPANLGGEIHFTDDGASGQRLRDFTMSKTGTAILGTDLTIRRNFTTTSGETVLPSGTTAGTNTLTLLGNHVRESIGGNGTLTGSNESHIVIQGNGDLGDPLYFTAGSQFIQVLDLDRQTNGIVELGTDLRIGETADVDGELTMTNGEFVINGNTLTLVPSTSGYSRTNGTFTGSATSRLEIQGAGDVGGSTATGTLNFTDDGANGQELLDFDVTRSGGTAYLGTDLTVLDVFTLEESDFNIGINGNTFTIDGTPVSSGTVGRLIGDNVCGGTSRLIIDGVNELGQIGFNTSGEFFKAFRITNTNAVNTTAALISATNLTVCDTMELANDSHLGLGGASGNENTVTFEGYLINDGTNTLVGSHFANLVINGATADNLGGTAATPVYFDAITSEGQYLKTLTIDRNDGSSNPGTVTLGTNLNVGDEASSTNDGTFTFTDGILELNDLQFRLNSQANNFTSSSDTRSVFRGSTQSDLYFNGPGNLGGTVFFIIDGGDADAQVLENFRINRTGGDSGDNEVDMGSNLRVDGELHLEYGRLDLSASSAHVFNINGTLTRIDSDPTARKVENDGGLIGGTTSSNLTIGNGNNSQISLFLDDGNTGTRSLRDLTIERVNNGGTPSVVLRSELRTNGTLTIPANATFDMEVNKTGAASVSSRGLLIWGTLAGDGLIQGSFTEDIICNGTIGGTLNFEAGARELRSFMMWNSSNTTVGLGTDLTIGDPSALSEMYVDLSLNNTRDNTLILNGNTLTLNSSANRFENRTNGTLTGDYDATLIVNGTGDLGGDLYFEAGARELEFLTINRTSTGIATLGTDLTLGDAGLGTPTGVITLTEGHFEINGNSLTINNEHDRTNGEFVGSTTSDLTIGGREDFDALVFDVGSAANYTLENLTITRTLDNAGSALDIDMGTDLIVGNSDDTDVLTIGDGAVLSLEGNHLTASGTLAFNTSGAIRGSYTSDLTLTGLGTAMGTLRFRTDAATDNHVNDFVFNRTDASGSVTLGSDINVGQPSTGGSPFDGTVALTNGALVMNGNVVTINSTVNNFSRGTNGSFTGDYSADLILNGSGNLGSSIAFTSGAERLEVLEIHRDAITDDVVLGTDLTVGDGGQAIPTGQVIIEDGELQINGNALTINNDLTFTTGQFLGSATSDLTIGGRGAADPLMFQTSTATDYTLENLTITRSLDDGGSNIDIDMATDLIVGVNDDTDILTIGTASVLSLEGNTLTLRGTANLNTTGRLRGSYTSDLVVEGTQNTNLGTLYFSADAATDNYLNTFSMNRISGTVGSVTLGNALNVGEPSGAGSEFNGVFTLTAGTFILNGQSLTINSTANNYVAGANGNFTGDNAADLIVNGTGAFGSDLTFTAGNEILQNFTINRTSSGLVNLGTDLTMSDGGTQTGELLLNEGELSIGANTLTISNEHNRVNGNFIGSVNSNMLINGQDDFDPLVFNTSSDANHTLLNLEITRTQNAAAASLDIDLGSNLIVGTTGSGELDLNGANVVLSLEGNDLTLNGDLAERDGTIRGINTSSMTIGGTGAVTGTLKFTSGSRTLDAITINRSGAAAMLTMGTDVTLDGTNTVNSLTLTDGYITTTNTNLITLNGTALVTGATYIDGTGAAGGSGGSDASFINGPIAKTFNANLGTFRFPVGKNTTFLEGGVKDLSTFPSTIRAEYYDSGHPDAGNINIASGILRVSVLEWWDITETSGSGTTAKVLAHWNSNSDVTDPTLLKVGHYHNGGSGLSWYSEEQSANAGSATVGYQISNQVTSFSPFTHAANTFVDNPLPITLVDFNATYVEGDGVRLDWETASELNNKGFILKRSIGNPDNFETIADYTTHDALIGKGTTNQTSLYETWDVEANLKAGEVHYYQLSQVDFDGTTTSFRIKAVNIGGKVVLFQNYPNPAQERTTISFSTNQEGHAYVGVYNTLGILVDVVYDGQVGVGTHEYEQNLEKYASGTYFIRLFFDAKVQTKKMVVVK